MGKITAAIRALLQCFGLCRTTADEGDTQAAPEKPVYAGPQIITNADAVFLHHNDNIALVVDHEFEDVPSWIEWDEGQGKIIVAQMGGTITEIETKIPAKELEEYKEQKRLYLIANYGGEKIIHHLSFIVRD
ncbi:MAG: hypothetical protein H6867_04200 [Rhodospirillales bacterium]|nr:hypothetical protein [Rhodospirillales bacterium]MCB9996352.1 hypothetical protein [Rhodospirillales bacterium]